ncbi:twin-arginine translocation pathway signal [Neisseria bacilliformis ATCC BAA-1200]|uniref:Twin-arginine translocation pathway signal n=1 Tax=Neisseria bacilliformis ATCC BAA-1200 TaxID=888742 RepID=F2BA21_9NEIS|nr:twin-arginine translocation pathway signal [Neisseria bacilliformis ATCC BAA-1200]
MAGKSAPSPDHRRKTRGRLKTFFRRPFLLFSATQKAHAVLGGVLFDQYLLAAQAV